jgi:hypothetical protein
MGAAMAAATTVANDDNGDGKSIVKSVAAVAVTGQLVATALAGVGAAAAVAMATVEMVEATAAVSIIFSCCR